MYQNGLECYEREERIGSGRLPSADSGLFSLVMTTTKCDPLQWNEHLRHGTKRYHSSGILCNHHVSAGGPDYTIVTRNLALELVRVTEAAALAGGQWLGKGDKNAADQVRFRAWCVLGT